MFRLGELAAETGYMPRNSGCTRGSASERPDPGLLARALFLRGLRSQILFVPSWDVHTFAEEA